MRGLRMKGIWFLYLAHQDKHQRGVPQLMTSLINICDANSVCFELSPSVFEPGNLVVFIICNLSPSKTNIWLLLEARGSLERPLFHPDVVFLCSYEGGMEIVPLRCVLKGMPPKRNKFVCIPGHRGKSKIYRLKSVWFDGVEIRRRRKHAELAER